MKDNNFKIEINDVYCQSAYHIGSRGKSSNTKINPFEGENCPETSSFYLWPNPVTDEVNIHSDLISQGFCVIRIYNVIGLVIIEQKVNVGNPGHIKINVGKLSKGMYMAEVRSAAGSKRGKVIKE
jgi:hypothetical protein